MSVASRALVESWTAVRQAERDGVGATPEQTNQVVLDCVDVATQLGIGPPVRVYTVIARAVVADPPWDLRGARLRTWVDAREAELDGMT